MVIVITDELQYQVQYLGNKALEKVSKWPEERKLELALDKTEVVVLNAPIKRDIFKIALNGVVLSPLRRLSIWEDTIKRSGKFNNVIWCTGVRWSTQIH